MIMRNKKTDSDSNGERVYVGSRVPLELKEKLQRRAKRERRSEAAIIEMLLSKELVAE